MLLELYFHVLQYPKTFVLLSWSGVLAGAHLENDEFRAGQKYRRGVDANQSCKKEVYIREPTRILNQFVVL